MPSLNKVFLMGNLTHEPEARYTPAGKAVTTFRLAVNDSWTNQAGEKQTKALFIKVTTWNRTAELCGSSLKKGNPVLVEGRLELREWEADGVKRQIIEAVGDRVTFMAPPSGRQSDAQPDESAAEDVPF